MLEFQDIGLKVPLICIKTKHLGILNVIIVKRFGVLRTPEEDTNKVVKVVRNTFILSIYGKMILKTKGNILKKKKKI